MAQEEELKQALLQALESLPAQAKRGLLDRLNQAAKTSRARIPGEISIAHYAEINQLLLDVLSETGAMQVVARLNETDKEEPAPVFVGWVENDERALARVQKNDSHPTLLRAGDTDPSTTYERCFLKGSIERNWMDPSHVQERKRNELCLSQKTGVNYLLVIRIEVQENEKQRRGVGVLGAGFKTEPADPANVRGILRSWAQSEKHALVPYLRRNFELGGPVL
jgi:hypothetical protein